MNAPLVEGEPVQIVMVLVRQRPRGFISGLFGTEPPPIYVGHRVRRAVASSTVIAGVVQAREQRFGRNIRPLDPANEGISWCRGWAAKDRDALIAAWKLYLSAT